MWRVYNLRHTAVLTYSHANTPLSQSERAYYLSCFIILASSQLVHAMKPCNTSDHLDQWLGCNLAFASLTLPLGLLGSYPQQVSCSLQNFRFTKSDIQTKPKPKSKPFANSFPLILNYNRRLRYTVSKCKILKIVKWVILSPQNVWYWLFSIFSFTSMAVLNIQFHLNGSEPHNK